MRLEWRGNNRKERFMCNREYKYSVHEGIYSKKMVQNVVWGLVLKLKLTNKDAFVTRFVTTSKYAARHKDDVNMSCLFPKSGIYTRKKVQNVDWGLDFLKTVKLTRRTLSSPLHSTLLVIKIGACVNHPF